MNDAVIEKAQQPKFSVIIPTYNSADTLVKSIESVLVQTWPAHEIIVVDDGSTDNTKHILQDYSLDIISITQENQGVAAARNQGAKVATGNWLAFLDADDWYYADRIMLHAEWIVRDANLDFLTGDYEYYKNGSPQGLSMQAHHSGRVMLNKSSGALEVVMESSEFELFVADHFGDTHTLSVPRNTFFKLGGYPVGFKVCEDVHFLSRLCSVSQRVGVICKPMGAYRIHELSATRTSPLTSQENNVQTLIDLKLISSDFPQPVRRGVMARLRDARLNLGYALLKSGRQWKAIRSVLPSIIETPGFASFRNLLSILKG